jgi:hypothetical protein
MRKILALLAAIAAFDAFGIGATQEWVKRQLAALARPTGSTNISVVTSVPASLVTDEPGASATVSITSEVGSHAALKVVASTVPGIPAGTFYAVDGEGVYHNRTITVLPQIYSACFSVATATTNALGVAGSKSVRMGNFWAVDSGGRAWRMGIDGDTLLYCTSDRTKYIAIRSTTLPQRAVQALLPIGTASTVRSMLSLVLPHAHARTSSETAYTVNGDKTVAIGQITVIIKNRFGKETVVTFTPKDLQGVYNGPCGPFATKEEAQQAMQDIGNWDFGDWESIWNQEGSIRITREQFEKSDVWKQFLDLIGTDTVDTLVPTPGMPAHPCPAPDDFWVFDAGIWNDSSISDADAARLAWKVNSRFALQDNPYDYDQEKLEEWRGQHNCQCGVVGCSNSGVSQHRVGRVRIKDGEVVTSDDVDGGDGCKCCVRCVKYGGDVFATIDEYNDHRANGADSGFCGCACGRFTAENEADWTRDYHNWPLRVGGQDYACMCYCSKDKALGGAFVRHVKYKGDSPWCSKLCGACMLVEDKEQYISHSWPAFDTRHVTLKEAEWSDHTPRSETEDAVGMPADPDYYSRCGCACGAYDAAVTSGLPADFASFHQASADTCKCQCGQLHTKNRRGEDEVEPFPCSDICAICKQVKDEESEAVFTFDGQQYKKLVMRDPDQEKDHTPHESECGCKCYNETTSRYAWSIGALATDSTTIEHGVPKWHKHDDESCGCACDAISPTATGERSLLWKLMHIDWATESECPKICGYCDKLRELGEESKEEDHEPSLHWCGCACGYITEETENDRFHKLRQQAPGFACLCPCEKKHDGEWKMCGDKLRVCSIFPDHTDGEGGHQFAGGAGDSISHPCKCGNQRSEHIWSEWVQTSARPHILHGKRVCTVAGCGNTRYEDRDCSHRWGDYVKVGEYPGGSLFRRTCGICGATEDLNRDYDGANECDAKIGFHVPAEDECGCVCGHYGESKASDTKDFHKWSAEIDATEGVADCHCKCGKMHEFRTKSGFGCPKVCAFCKELRKNGSRATEADHSVAPSYRRRCGCACGYYGVTSEHENSGHLATTSRLHIQSRENNTTSASTPSYCQCYGAEGTGGRWHWHHAKAATSCSKICRYKRTGEKFGHLASTENPDQQIKAATPEDHVGKTDHTSGCGCKCGDCGKGNADDWKRNKALHQYNSSQTDRCHCACDEKVLCGDTMVDNEPHTFPITNGGGQYVCTCTCGNKHRNDGLNACGFCSVCKQIWRNGVRIDASVPGNHLWHNGGCYCDGGCVVNGNKMLPIPDEHQFVAGKCVCVCGEKTRDHILVDEKERIGQWTCWKCNAVFLNFRVTTRCSRCGEVISTGHVGSVGEHNPGCGEQKPSCYKCGCHCTTWGSHTTCNIHYCNACCTKKPPKPPRPPKPDPDDPNPEPEPEPPEPYVTCKHPRTDTHDWDYNWTCEKCQAEFHDWGWRKHCADCGAYIDSESHNEGKHGPPCNGEDPGHECEPSLCGEALNDGGTCQESFCHSCESCPNASQHKSHHGGNGGSGGGGGLEDI